MDRRSGRPISLISTTNDNRLTINQETLQLIQSFAGPFCFLSICGDYRSGKSFLLNSLFFSGTGFDVSSTTQPCTKGIRIWSQPIQQANVNMWIIDTEGFGSTNRDSGYDGKIFLLSLLISNIVLYNSFGALDEASIQKFSAICLQANFLDSSITETSLFWLLRDFSLEIKSKEGSIITADEYLEMALHQNSGNSSREQKTFIKKVFAQRYCVPLIRPVIDESRLGMLKNMELGELRGQYVDSIYKLRKTILNCVSAKKINSIEINRENLGVILESYIKMINEGKVETDFNCTYQKIMRFEMQRQTDNIVTHIENRFHTLAKDLPFTNEKVISIQKEIKSQVSSLLHQKVVMNKGTFRDYQLERQCSEAINSKIGSELKKLIQKNNLEVHKEITEYLQDQFTLFTHKVVSFVTPENFQLKYYEPLGKLKQGYRSKFNKVYERSAMIFNEFIEREERKIFEELAKKWHEKQKQSNEKLDQTKKAKKNADEETRKLRQEINRLVKSIQQSKREEKKNIQQLRVILEEQHTRKINEINAKNKAFINDERNKFQESLRQMKGIIQKNEEQNMSLEGKHKFQTRQLKQKLQSEKDKSELLQIKVDQSQASFDKQLEQSRSNFESRLKVLEAKNSELQTHILNQRQKLKQLSEDCKNDETELLGDIAQKNEKIMCLRMELVQIEERYKNQLEQVLLEEKQIICESINSKIQEYEHTHKVYQKKIEEYYIANQELAKYKEQFQEEKQRNHHLQAENSQCSSRITHLTDQLAAVEQKQKQNQQINQNLLQQCKELQMSYHNLKESSQQERNRLNHQNEELKKNLDGLPAEITQKQELKHLKQTHQLKKQFQTFLEQERSALTKQIKHGITESQALKLQVVMMANQLAKIRQDLLKIKDLYFNFSGEKFQADRNDPNSNEFRDESNEYLTEQLSEIFECLYRELSTLKNQRKDLKESFQVNKVELQKCQEFITKMRNQNKSLRADLDKTSTNLSQKQEISTKYSKLESQNQNLQKDIYRLKREIELHNETYARREQTIRDNSLMYKETIANLQEQNKAMSEEKLKFEIKIQQFLEQNQSAHYPRSSFNLNEDNERIKSMEVEIKRLTKKLQEEKLHNFQKQLPKRDSVSFNSAIQDNRLMQLDHLRKENVTLRKRIQQIREKELKEIEEKKSYRQKLIQVQEKKSLAVKEELEAFRKKSKQNITELQRKVENLTEQRSNLKKQLNQMREQQQKTVTVVTKMAQEDCENLKKEKTAIIEQHQKEVHFLQENLSNARNDYERKLLEIKNQTKNQQSRLSREYANVSLESDRQKMKYEHLLKVNNELLKQIESLKTLANQKTLKEKYKSKISQLIQDT